MKKIVAVFLSVLMLLAFPVAAYAGETDDTVVSSTVEYFEDGSYQVTVIEEQPALTRASTKSGSKTVKHYNSDDELEWYVKLSATFSYTGSSATCTSATPSYKIYNTKWKVSKSSASRSGRTATGNFEVKYYVLGIPVTTEPVVITLSCSNSGTLS